MSGVAATWPARAVAAGVGAAAPENGRAAGRGVAAPFDGLRVRATPDAGASEQAHDAGATRRGALAAAAPAARSIVGGGRVLRRGCSSLRGHLAAKKFGHGRSDHQIIIWLALVLVPNILLVPIGEIEIEIPLLLLGNSTAFRGLVSATR